MRPIRDLALASIAHIFGGWPAFFAVLVTGLLMQVVEDWNQRR